MRAKKPKERDLCPNIIKIEELCSGSEGHEGYFKKSERQDQWMWRFMGAMFILAPLISIASAVVTAFIIRRFI